MVLQLSITKYTIHLVLQHCHNFGRIINRYENKTSTYPGVYEHQPYNNARCHCDSNIPLQTEMALVSLYCVNRSHTDVPIHKYHSQCCIWNSCRFLFILSRFPRRPETIVEFYVCAHTTLQRAERFLFLFFLYSRALYNVSSFCSPKGSCKNVSESFV